MLDGAFGADDIIGNFGGLDRVQYGTRAAGVTVTLLGGADDGNADDDNGSRRDNVNPDVERITATDFNDTLSGTNFANMLNGGLGDDVLSGLNGMDIVVGGVGADDVSGGNQRDTTSYDSSFAGNDHFADVTVTLDGVANDGSTEDDNGSRRDNICVDVENITGGNGNDTLNGNAVPNSLSGGAGDDTLLGLDESDGLGGGSGNDILDAAAGDNSLGGGDGNDTLTSLGGGNDTLSGDNGDDDLDAGAGNNTLDAGAGNDTLISLEGVDSLDWWERRRRS